MDGLIAKKWIVPINDQSVSNSSIGLDSSVHGIMVDGGIDKIPCRATLATHDKINSIDSGAVFSLDTLVGENAYELKPDNLRIQLPDIQCVISKRVHDAGPTDVPRMM
ncbi:hypothetical protein Nepgr_018845 [Nepenthes gracilis]|uniref:Uncharacterized protein n=1 Tax=Nepenthes gracilis TaxID=150966 RepID=A0AAD3SU49_NEPGR|nr:hypothetical protein Nepgr_018845 [Nepenthes gracilis]